MISLEGLDKAEVFAALYNGARAQGLGFLQYDPQPMTTEQARERFGDSFGYFDYVDGRVMKIDLSGSELNPWLYDRDNGQGAAATIIDALKATVDVNPEEAERIHKEGTYHAAQIMRKYKDPDFSNTLKSKLDDILGEDK